MNAVPRPSMVPRPQIVMFFASWAQISGRSPPTRWSSIVSLAQDRAGLELESDVALELNRPGSIDARRNQDRATFLFRAGGDGLLQGRRVQRGPVAHRTVVEDVDNPRRPESRLPGNERQTNDPNNCHSENTTLLAFHHDPTLSRAITCHGAANSPAVSCCPSTSHIIVLGHRHDSQAVTKIGLDESTGLLDIVYHHLRIGNIEGQDIDDQTRVIPPGSGTASSRSPWLSTTPNRASGTSYMSAAASSRR